jgi:outer membrane protein assembly factor BamB
VSPGLQPLLLAILAFAVGLCPPSPAAASTAAAHANSVQTDWPMFRFDPSLHGVNTFENTINKRNVHRLALDWSQRIGYGFTLGNMVSAPAVSRGIVYSGSFDRLSGFDAATGALLWKHPARVPVGGFESSPAVAGGILYIGDDKGRILALDAATGAHVWAKQTGFSVQASPVVVNGVVYIRSLDGYLYALDATTGAQVWARPVAGFFSSSSDSSVAVVGGTVYLSEEGALEARDAATGDRLRRTPCGRASSSPSPTVADGVVYFGVLDDSFNEGILCAVEADTGKMLWSWSPEQPGVPDVLVQRGVVYALIEGTTYALDAESGSLLWSRDTGLAIFGPPSLANGVLYATGRGIAAALDPATGDILWTAHVFDLHPAAPPVIANGRLYVSVEDTRLYAYALP